jgi:GR25 family glycosyltransferase involved in LPS biosynthesis
MKSVSYVINLNTRPDRLHNVIKRFNSIGEEFERVEAITGDSQLEHYEKFIAPKNVVANWKSHLECYRKFLESDADVCLIFEDDVEFTGQFKNFLNQLRKQEHFDFDIFQFGYLGSKSNFNPFRKFKDVFTHSVFKYMRSVLQLILQNKPSKVSDKLSKIIDVLKYRIVKSNEFQLNGIIIPGFVSGTHAYAISRDMAQHLLPYNNPTILGADLALQILSMSGNWNIYRTPKSLALQDATSVSIGEHSTVVNDLGSDILGESR